MVGSLRVFPAQVPLSYLLSGRDAPVHCSATALCSSPRPPAPLAIQSPLPVAAIQVLRDLNLADSQIMVCEVWPPTTSLALRSCSLYSCLSMVTPLVDLGGLSLISDQIMSLARLEARAVPISSQTFISGPCLCL